jgi:hypothetical protein
MLLLSCSVKYRFQKIKSIIDIIADMTAVQLIRRQWGLEEQFFAGIIEGLQETTCGSELRRDPEWRGIF